MIRLLWGFAAGLRRAAGLVVGGVLCWAAVLVVAAEQPGAAAGRRLQFNRDIRPLLTDTCFTCHGPDASKRKADLRLDTRRGMLGKPDEPGAVVPGKPDESELYLRITSRDVHERMPPPAFHQQLTSEQINLLRRWIEQGAPYQDHWAYLVPERAELPAVGDSAWPRNPIDYFILARLEKQGLKPSPPADRPTFLRRLTLDLTGLPPLPSEIDAYAGDASPEADRKVIDRLLASPRHAERMAVEWLDAARYADTHGYHIDSHRDMWRWRDWVIDAFRQNLPFDRFTIEQLAGDLLPQATFEQKLATGFNRNNMVNFEGGADPAEYAVEYVIDRVNTTSTVWLGLTMSCARCHDHKYDPITQRDFYRFYALFNNVPEEGLDGRKGNAVPLMPAPSPQQRKECDRLQADVARAAAALAQQEPAVAAAQAVWEERMAAAAPQALDPTAGLLLHLPLDETAGLAVADVASRKHTATIEPGKKIEKEVWTAGKRQGAVKLGGGNFIRVDQGPEFDRGDAFSYGAWIKPAGKGGMAVLAKMDDAQGIRGYDLYLSDRKVMVHLIHHWPDDALRVTTRKPLDGDRWHHVFATYDGSGKAAGVQVYVDGRIQDLDRGVDKLSGTLKHAQPLHVGRRSASAAYQGLIDDVRIYGRALDATEVAQLADSDPLRPILAVAVQKRSTAQQATLRKEFLMRHAPPELRKLAQVVADAEANQRAYEATIPTSMVMQEMATPRTTHLLLRGNYLTPGEEVPPGTPAFLPPLPAGVKVDRLALARWLVDPKNPLPTRVVVNRYWQMYFGTGLVKTSEDFGVQGEWPSHPELLDWLATEFVRSGWDVRAMQRLIVSSATYRQASRVSGELLQQDPENRLLGRGPRFRLPAEMIRDLALSAGGLLDPRVGGPSVFPYQPAGLWEEMAFDRSGKSYSAQVYTPSHGADLYRRSMYTFWKRTVPPASLSTFDAPDREICAVRRSRTNTPLQSLVLMNDPTYVEAARHLAQRMLSEGGAMPAERITFAYRLLAARPPRPQEIKLLADLYRQQRQRLGQADQAAAAQGLVSVGESPRPDKLDPAELAAWTIVASVILNLDETVTKG